MPNNDRSGREPRGVLRTSSPEGGHSLGTPSKFWNQLGRQHADYLRSRGLASLKRTLALRYFTWRWRPALWAKGEQIRFLLRHTSPQTWLSCALTPNKTEKLAWDGVPWSWLERRLYVIAVRLLWEYAYAHADQALMVLPEPAIGGPLPVHWKGRLISQDLANSVIEVTAMQHATSQRTIRSILEIGAGYGRTAFVLLHAFPTSIYTIVDIEPALSVARWYLQQLFPPERLIFLRPDQASELPPGSIDLALTISSLQEMTASQVNGYLSLLDNVAAGGVVFLKQRASWRNPIDGVTLDFEAYPVPARWQLIFDEVAPVQTAFRQAAWTLPNS